MFHCKGYLKKHSHNVVGHLIYQLHNQFDKLLINQNLMNDILTIAEFD